MQNVHKPPPKLCAIPKANVTAKAKANVSRQKREKATVTKTACKINEWIEVRQRGIELKLNEKKKLVADAVCYGCTSSSLQAYQSLSLVVSIVHSTQKHRTFFSLSASRSCSLSPGRSTFFWWVCRFIVLLFSNKDLISKYNMYIWAAVAEVTYNCAHSMPNGLIKR